MQAILWDRLRIADVVGDADFPGRCAQGYAEFDAGAPRKFVIDPHGALLAA